MKEYLFLFRGGNSSMAAQSAEEKQAHMQNWMKWMGLTGLGFPPSSQIY